MIADILYSVPSFALFLIISLFFISLAVGLTLLISRRLGLEFRFHQNDAIVCISAIISVIYAILVGFTVLYELNTFDKSVQAESEEGKAVFTIYRDALLMPEPVSAELRKQIVNYGTEVVENEWSRMANGKFLTDTGRHSLNNISDILNTLRKEKENSLSASQDSTLDELFSTNDSLFDLHEERAGKAHMSIIPGMWLVLIIGTFLTLGMTTILGMDLRLHLITVAATALMLSAVLYLLFIIDSPYRGEFAVQPWTLVATLKYIGWQKNDDINPADLNRIEERSAGRLPFKHLLGS